jgi:hypothetical protein
MDFVFFEKEGATLSLCIKKMHTIFIQILFNIGLARTYTKVPEGTTPHLQP